MFTTMLEDSLDVHLLGGRGASFPKNVQTKKNGHRSDELSGRFS
ncbi:hypothetical protein [Halomonas sp. ND22Bw]